MTDGNRSDTSPGSSPVHQLITTEEYAEMARTSPSTIRYWRANGIGPAGTKRGKRVLYPRAQVLAYLLGTDAPPAADTAA